MSKLEELFEVCKKHGVDFSYNAFTQELEVRKFLKDATGEFHSIYDSYVYLSASEKTEDELIQELIRFIQEKENLEEEKEEQ